MTTTVVRAGEFPQTGDNRTLQETADELLQFVGGVDDPEQLKRAKDSLRAAVRRYNSLLWNFTRASETITLLSSIGTYALDKRFRAPVRVTVEDSGGVMRGRLARTTWTRFIDLHLLNAAEAQIPIRYTVENPHKIGDITISRTPASTITYPTVRVYQFRRIEFPANPKEKLNVPAEVGEGIFRWALADIIHKVRGGRASQPDQLIAREYLLDVRKSWEGYEDRAIHGVGPG